MWRVCGELCECERRVTMRRPLLYTLLIGEWCIFFFFILPLSSSSFTSSLAFFFFSGMIEPATAAFQRLVTMDNARGVGVGSVGENALSPGLRHMHYKVRPFTCLYRVCRMCRVYSVLCACVYELTMAVRSSEQKSSTEVLLLSVRCCYHSRMPPPLSSPTHTHSHTWSGGGDSSGGGGGTNVEGTPHTAPQTIFHADAIHRTMTVCAAAQ